MSRADEFMDIYRQLEAIATDKYNLPKDGKAVSFLEKQPEFRNIRLELGYCHEVRNLLTHNPKISDKYTVDPSEEMIELLKNTVEKVINPPKAKSIMIPKQKILWRTMNDFILPVVHEMVSKTFTNIPILEECVVIGVFSESTLLSYLVDEEIISIDDHMVFSDLEKYLWLKNHTAESFRFVSEDTLKTTIEDMFSDANKHGERIGLIFVTHSGRATEKVLGIITAWDLVDSER